MSHAKYAASGNNQSDIKIPAANETVSRNNG